MKIFRISFININGKINKFDFVSKNTAMAVSVGYAFCDAFKVKYACCVRIK